MYDRVFVVFVGGGDDDDDDDGGGGVCISIAVDSTTACRYLCFCIKCKMIYVHYLFRKHCRFNARLLNSLMLGDIRAF